MSEMDRLMRKKSWDFTMMVYKVAWGSQNCIILVSRRGNFVNKEKKEKPQSKQSPVKAVQGPQWHEVVCGEMWFTKVICIFCVLCKSWGSVGFQLLELCSLTQVVDGNLRADWLFKDKPWHYVKNTYHYIIVGLQMLLIIIQLLDCASDIFMESREWFYIYFFGDEHR